MDKLIKNIPGYDSLYGITSDGMVWSKPKSWTSGLGYKKKHSGRWMASRLRGSYLVVGLNKDGGQKMFSIARLVLLSWAGPPPDGRQFINHKNGIKTDNRIENLEWCSLSYNCKHAWENGLQKFTDKMRNAVRKNAYHARKANRRLSKRNIVEICRDLKTGTSQRILAEKFKVSQATISNLKTGKYYKES